MLLNDAVKIQAANENVILKATRLIVSIILLKNPFS